MLGYKPFFCMLG